MAVQTLTTSPVTREKATPLTGEELNKIGDIGRTELVKGEIVYMSPTGYPHGDIESNFSLVLKSFVRERKLGRVFGGEVGIYTHRNPDTVRAADVAYVSRERMAQVKSLSYLDVAPELVVEVMSLDDTWGNLMDKLDEYFAIGVKAVWVADPRTRQVYVYRSVTDVKRFTEHDMLPGDDVLPGFSVSVAELFATE
jgi:Uma2 family endonuclease